MSDNTGWYYADGGKPVGPMTIDELIAALSRRGGGAADTMVFGPGMLGWEKARTIDRIASQLRGAAPPPPPPINYQGARPASDVIDYKIFGEEMQYAEVTLDPGEMVVAEAGGMMYMTPGIS